MKYRIGILDDEAGKVTLILSHLKDGFSGKSMKRRYADVSFDVVEFEVKRDIYETVAEIIDKQVQCMIIDYKLNSQRTAAYNGIAVAKKLVEYNEFLPLFILTSYEEDLFDHELFNAYQVFDYERYLSEEKERDELHGKLVQQIVSVQKQVEAWETELCELLPMRGATSEIDNRILELDSRIERSFAAKHSLPQKTKEELSISNLSLLIEKLDKILGGE
jgi:hypothetical protein